MTHHPLLTISIPSFDRPESLERTLHSLDSQTSKDFCVHISDNCSAQKEEYERLMRVKWSFNVRLSRQDSNIGHLKNFKYLLTSCSSKYHMWLADDDRVDSEFIGKSLKAIEFGNHICVSSNYVKDFPDGSQKLIKVYPDLKQSTHFFKDSYDLIYSHKNNNGFFKKVAIYGIFRTDILKKVVLNNPLWINERDILLLLRQYGTFFFNHEYMFYKRTAKGINLEKSDPFHLALDMRGSWAWYIDLINHRKSFLYGVFFFFFLLPKLASRFFKKVCKNAARYLR